MTVKEIADLCGVSQNSIRKWCIRNNVKKTKDKQQAFIIDEYTKGAIISYYGQKKPKSSEQAAEQEASESSKLRKSSSDLTEETAESEQSTPERACGTVGTYCNEHQQEAEQQAQSSELTSIIQKLTDQNAALTSTIQSLTEQNKTLTSTIQSLTEQLTAAQQLHAGTIKALLTEQSKPDEQEQEAPESSELKESSSDLTEEAAEKKAQSVSDEQAEAEPKKKKSLFSRLFKRKTEKEVQK